MFEKFSRSWSLVKASASVLQSDRHLLVFPLVSGIAALLVAASFILPLLGMGVLGRLDGGGDPGAGFYLWLFAFYAVQYFVMIFFNVALVGAAMIRLDGGVPTLADGLRIARDRLGAILGYALIAATVGVVLRMIEQRAGFIGRWVIGLVGVAWTVATFLVVPVLVARGMGPVDAVKQSASLLRRSWGENLIGNGGIGLSFGLLTMAVMIGGMALAITLLANGSDRVGIFVGAATVVIVVILGLVQAALSGIYSAVLYRFAVAGDVPGGFSGELLSDAFRRKA